MSKSPPASSCSNTCSIDAREASASGDERYFLDKTPRYALAVGELFRAFPDARFVFLWRHPLAMVASILETWGLGRWNLHYFKADVFDGVARLVAASRAHGERCVALRYEDLVREPEKQSKLLTTVVTRDHEHDVAICGAETLPQRLHLRECQLRRAAHTVYAGAARLETERVPVSVARLSRL